MTAGHRGSSYPSRTGRGAIIYQPPTGALVCNSGELTIFSQAFPQGQFRYFTSLIQYLSPNIQVFPLYFYQLECHKKGIEEYLIYGFHGKVGFRKSQAKGTGL